MNLGLYLTSIISSFFTTGRRGIKFASFFAVVYNVCFL